MSLNFFLKELLKALVFGTLIFFGFIGYYYLTDDLGANFGFADAWEEYYTNIVFSLVLYMFNMIWIYYLLKKWLLAMDRAIE